MQSLRQCICCASLQIRLNVPIQCSQKWAMPQCYLHVSNYHSAKNKLNSPSYNLFDTRHSKPWCLSQSWLTWPTGCMEQRRFKGHSKWQNIKHIKGLKDDIKQKIINKTMARLRMAIKEGGGSVDPRINQLVARSLEEAKQKDVPMATIQAYFKRLENPKTAGSEFYIEAKGVSNSFLIMECFAESQTKARNSTQNILKKFGGQIGDKGFASHFFDQKGVVVLVPGDNPLSLDQAEEVAIEAGAEDVEEAQDEDNNTLIRFICDKKETNAVKKSLIELQYPVKEATLEYVPHTFIELSDQELELCAQMSSMLEGLEHCVKVFYTLK